MLKFLLKF